MYICRPGVKWNFDFKVEIPPVSELKEGKHDQIARLLRELKEKNKQEFDNLWQVITLLYDCTNNDVDVILQQNPIRYEGTLPIDILLKVIKWMFIMEDIIYWHYEGRAFLYNFFSYVINEENESRLQDTLDKIKTGKIKPHRIKKLLEECNIQWRPPKEK